MLATYLVFNFLLVIQWIIMIALMSWLGFYISSITLTHSSHKCIVSKILHSVNLV